ncbi:hypothetical protein [Sandaracinus amylolyticus]|uniref:Uncharacterized protein n=1 Tax=Sandaracinus amylolyticus TaxID=927083 RepID=A0A0F6W7B8_9BACT|nr:hypothetical protein [Sandaracinus amylolyticus]AKF09255.1 hypothetical protein DB32_006404 [Sandaracinus amylolyticus]
MNELRDVPPEPQVPDAQRGAGMLPLRYEDVVQDGRLRLEPVTHAIGAAIWKKTLSEHPLVLRLGAEGIVPILSRLQVEAGGGPISAREPVSARGTFELLRLIDDQDRQRLRVDMWAELQGTRGHTHGAAIEGAGEPVLLGRAIAEHVLTRPFAPPEERSVEQLPGELPEGMTTRDVAWRAPRTAIDLPRGATPIDDAFALDPVPIVFGLGHTDSNQHVNSLVYPRLLEEAALRRFHQLDLPTTVLARYVDLAFRKPCFAGDRMRIMLRAYRAGDEVGVLGAFITSGEAITAGATPTERAHVFARMQFAR